VPAEALQQQFTFALGIRDDITRLTAMVVRLQSLASQLQARVDTLKGDPKAAELLKASAALRAKCQALEARLHNPQAEVIYDILAQKGGTKLYSRLSPLLDWANQGDGAPAQGLREVHAAQRRELQQYEAEFQALSKDLAALNAQGVSLGYGFVQ